MSDNNHQIRRLTIRRTTSFRRRHRGVLPSPTTIRRRTPPRRTISTSILPPPDESFILTGHEETATISPPPPPPSAGRVFAVREFPERVRNLFEPRFSEDEIPIDNIAAERDGGDSGEGDGGWSEKESGGLSAEEIAETVKVGRAASGGEESLCVVCQDDLGREDDDRTVGILTCGHEFHVSCIREWLTRRNVCPLCRAVTLPWY